MISNMAEKFRNALKAQQSRIVQIMASFFGGGYDHKH